MTAAARLPIRVLTIGNAPAGPNSRGGMATMMRLLLEDSDSRFHIRVVPTYNDAPLAVRLWTGISGMVKASATLADRAQQRAVRIFATPSREGIRLPIVHLKVQGGILCSDP